jgi:hypothetical protein
MMIAASEAKALMASPSTVALIARFMQRWLLRHSQYGFALKVIKIDRRFADLTFAGDQYLNSGIAFS